MENHGTTILGQNELKHLIPSLGEKQQRDLEAFLDFSERHRHELNDKLIDALMDEPALGPIIRSQTEEQRLEQNEHSAKMQREAVLEGKWEQYNLDLMLQGMMYAKMGLDYSKWYEVIILYKEMCLPYLWKDHGDDPEQLQRVVRGMGRMMDHAMHVIAEAFFEEKNRVIKEQQKKQELLLATLETNHAKLQDSEERFRALFEGSSDHIFMVDSKGVIAFINHVAPGLNKEEVVGSSLLDWQTDEYRPVVEKTVKGVFKTGKQGFYEVQVPIGNSTLVYGSSVGPVFKDGKVVGAVVVARDITDKRQTEKELKDAMADLTKSQERFNLAVEGSSSGLWDWDLNTNEVFYASRFKELLGYKDAEYKNVFDSFEGSLHPEDKEMTFAAIDATLKEDEPYDITYRLRTKKGQYRWFIARAKVLRTEQGEPYRMAGSITDITERKVAEQKLRELNEQLEQRVAEKTQHLRESQQKLEKIIQHAGVGIALIGHDGKFLDVNPSFEQMLGYDRTQIIGKQHSAFTHQQDLKKDEEFYQLLQKADQEVYSLQKRYVTKNGHVLWSRITNTLLEGGLSAKESIGSEIKAIKIVTDITDIKDLEEKVLLLNRKLEKQLKQLESTNEELESFSYTVSHDLRAPLRAIDGFAKVLDKKLEGKLDADQTRYLDIIKSNVQKMGVLIDDLLSFSRMGRLEKSETVFDMKDLVERTFAELTQEVDRSKIQFVVHDIPKLKADREMMRHVISNLLGNAIKFSSVRDMPRIEVGANVTDDETVYYIKDNGVGFEMEYVGKIFSIFQRLHSDEEFEGTGVGLAIVQRIVHRHRGRVWAESKPEEGATFYMNIPNFKSEKS